MAREYKHYEIRKARTATDAGPLATTILVTDEVGNRGHGFIRFSDSLVNAAGKRLPRGVSRQDPAYLSVGYVPSLGVWDVSACYLNGEAAALLWRTESKPSWLNKIGVKHAHHAQETAAGPGTRPRTLRARRTRPSTPPRYPDRTLGASAHSSP